MIELGFVSRMSEAPSMANPYKNLPPSSFWKTGVASENPYNIEGIYKKKFSIASNAKVATAGSCFAQHISHALKNNGYQVLDVEPPPPNLPQELHHKHGYSLYSARYGNIYTVRQLLQLAQEAAGEWQAQNIIWGKNGRFYDALRPSINPEGFDSESKVVQLRSQHVKSVYSLFQDLDVLVFTLGLTEAWTHKFSGTVYPTAPGTIAGTFDQANFQLHNSQFPEIVKDFEKFHELLLRIRDGRPFQVLLTVSPVPLTATAAPSHILVSNTYSKSTLRAVAGHLQAQYPNIDYFPSFEIVTNPRLHSTSFEENLRSVRGEAVENVMRHFFKEHPPIAYKSSKSGKLLDQMLNAHCDEELLELFTASGGETVIDNLPKEIEILADKDAYLELVGNSHLNSFTKQLKQRLGCDLGVFFKLIHDANLPKEYNFARPMQLSDAITDGRVNNSFTDYCLQTLGKFGNRKRFGVIFVGMGIHGDCILHLYRFIAENGNLSSVPIINSSNEVSEVFMARLERQLAQSKNRLDLLFSINPSIFVRHILSPLPPERYARNLLGDTFVDSGSQLIYNQIYEKMMAKVLVNYIDKGIIIPHSDSMIGPTGFLLDKFANTRHPDDLHASPEFYRESIDSVLFNLSFN